MVRSVVRVLHVLKLRTEFAGMENALIFASRSGGLAQLVERLHGMQEVSGSNPLSSTPLPVRVSAKTGTLIFLAGLNIVQTFGVV